MTCREKLEIEYPESASKKLADGCPNDYGYARDPKYCDPFTEKCERCWDREVEEIEKEEGTDNVNNPVHYTQGEIECIDAIKASMSAEAFRGFLKGNVIKYAWRYMDKGKPAEDLKKAEWYLKRLIKEVESDEK